jgi:hypothetical protein
LPLTEHIMINNKITRTISQHSKFKCIPEGYSEFKLHPAHGKAVGRCLARSKSTGMQCNAIASKGFAVCHKHGGSKKSGKRTAVGEKARYDSVYKHGQRSHEVITRRSDASKELYVLRQAAYAIDMIPWWGSAKNKPKLNSVQLALKVVKK